LTLKKESRNLFLIINKFKTNSMLKRISFHRLKIEELISLSESIIKIIKNFELDKLQLTQFFNELKKAHQDLEKKNEHYEQSAISENMQFADDNRDNAFVAFRDYIKACNSRLKTDWEAPSQKLLNIIHETGWSLQTEKHKNQTEHLSKLIQKIEHSIEYKDAISHLKANEWFSELLMSHITFERLADEHLTDKLEEISDEVKRSVNNLRKAVIELNKYLETLYSMTGNGDIKQIIKEMNVEIEQIMKKVSPR